MTIQSHTPGVVSSVIFSTREVWITATSVQWCAEQTADAGWGRRFVAFRFRINGGIVRNLYIWYGIESRDLMDSLHVVHIYVIDVR
jgi:hypothetical protein